MAQTFVKDPNTTAIYMFPTKALARDQLRGIQEFFCAAGVDDVGAEAYDGDTPQEERYRIRRQSRLLITNPDMLHASVLPHHKEFATFLANLSFVVVDEAHSYTGSFGSHTSLVLRRLRRLCARAYQNRRGPQFILCSATIENPKEHAQKMIGSSQVTLVSSDGAPRGGKTWLLWNPPVKTEQHSFAEEEVSELIG